MLDLPRNWISRMLSKHSLRSQMLTLLLGATLGVGGVAVYFSYQRGLDQAVEEGQEWAGAMAQLLARSSANALVVHDEITLVEEAKAVVGMPGVKALRIVNWHGVQVLHVERGELGEKSFSYETLQLPPPAQSIVRHGNDRFRAFAPIHSVPLTSPDEATPWLRTGWVEIDFSYAPRLKETRSTWLIGSAITLGFVLLVLAIISRFLSATVRPIRKLAEYANAMTKEPGLALEMDWRSQELRELGQSLNWSSKEMARQIDEAQRRAQRQRAILDTAADAIIGVSQTGTVSSVNPAAERMFGLLHDELVGQPLSKFLDGMTSSALNELIANGMLIYTTQSRIGRMELNALRHGGTPFPIEVLIGEIPDDADIRYTCIVRDLSDIKIADEYLTLYGRVLDCTLNGIAISDARRHPQPIVHVNPAYTRITGYEASEVLGRYASFLEGPLTDKADIERLEKAMREGGECTLILKNYRKDGVMFYNKLSVSPVRGTDNSITHYITVIEDVTAQIEVKQRLIDRTTRLNTTFELSPDGFAVFGHEDGLLSSNPALRNMVGDIPPAITLHQFDAFLSSLCKDEQKYLPIVGARQDQGKFTMQLARPTHRVIEREIRQNMGASRETFVYFRDITHQFEVDRMKSEFLATAAHELRTPLASILGFTELMMHRKYSDEKRMDLLQTVHRQGSLLASLIQELLDLSRIEARQGKDFQIQSTSLSTLVHHVVQGLAGRNIDRPVQVAEIPACFVMADATKIEQALMNLLSNAFKYSPDGGEVSIGFERRLREGVDMVAIRVRDQGMGMTPAQLDRCFERFYRADASGNIPGTGLGLNLVKEIVEIHGGAMQMNSEFGKGTVATMWLKASPTLEVELVD